MHFVVGMYARFICYDDMFQPKDEGMEESEVDSYSVSEARYYLEEFIKQFTDSAPKSIGDMYKKIYKESFSRCTERTFIIYKQVINKTVFVNDTASVLLECAYSHSVFIHNKFCLNYCTEMCVLLGIDPGNETRHCTIMLRE